MGQFEGHFGICLAYGGGFGVILGALWAYKRRMAGMMHVVAGLMVSLSAPREPINRKYTFCEGFCLSRMGLSTPALQKVRRAEGDFGVTLMRLWGHLV